MREIRPSGSEGGVARKRHPYPYQTLREGGTRIRRREASGVRRIPPLSGAAVVPGRGLRIWSCHGVPTPAALIPRPPQINSSGT